MPISQARVPTAEASRYLKQLCRHWSHKFPVEATEDSGRVPFGEDRVCTFEAGPDALLMRVATPDPAALTAPGERGLRPPLALRLPREPRRDHLVARGLSIRPEYRSIRRSVVG